MTRRALLGLSSVVLGLFGLLLLAAAWEEAHGRRGLGRGRMASTPAGAEPGACPYLSDAHGGPAGESIRAYAAIESALAGGSLSGVPENAARIARFFRDVNPDIAASAWRLTRLRALPAARAEFHKLSDLFSQSPDGNAAPPAGRGEAEAAHPLLEI